MARHRPAHARSGLGRYTPPGRVRALHAAPAQPGQRALRVGVLLGTGVLASAGLGVLSVGSAGAVGGTASAPPSECFTTLAPGTFDLFGNGACAIGTAGEATAAAGFDDTGGVHDNTAFATIVGSLDSLAVAESASFAGGDAAHNVADAVAAGNFGFAVALVGSVLPATINFGDDEISQPDGGVDFSRNVAEATANAGFAVAEVGERSADFADNKAEATAGPLSFAVALTANSSVDAFRNVAIAAANLGATAIASAAGGVTEGTANFAAAVADFGGDAHANAGGNGGAISNQHHNTALATATMGTATATAGGFKSFEYNNLAEAGDLLGGTATAIAGTAEAHGGGSNNTAVADASYGGTATATVAGNTTGYAEASGGATTTVTETDQSSSLTSSAPVPGGGGFGYDADGNWVASLNFNGTDKTFSSVGNG